MTLAPPSFRITVHSVKCCHTCSWTIVLLDGFVVLRMVESPHACSFVVMWAQKLLLLLKLPDWHTIFFSIGVFGCYVLPSPLVIGFVLLFGVFVAFITRLFIALVLAEPVLTLFVGVQSLVVALLQHLYYCCHHQNLFLFIRWSSPGIVFIQQPCFILIFSQCHEFFSCIGCSSIISLTFHVLDVCDEAFIRGSLVSLPHVVCQVHGFLVSGMQLVHLLSHPAVEFGDISLLLPHMSCCWVVNPC